MMVNLHPTIQAFQLAQTSFDEAWFETVFLALDKLHDAVSEYGNKPGTRSVLMVTPTDMVGWLEDIIYTAQEAIVEIREHDLDETVTEAEYVG